MGSYGAIWGSGFRAWDEMSRLLRRLVEFPKQLTQSKQLWEPYSTSKTTMGPPCDREKPQAP